jgi:hypothetical protein
MMSAHSTSAMFAIWWISTPHPPAGSSRRCAPWLGDRVYKSGLLLAPGIFPPCKITVKARPPARR